MRGADGSAAATRGDAQRNLVSTLPWFLVGASMTAHDISIHKSCAVIDRAYKEAEKPFRGFKQPVAAAQRVRDSPQRVDPSGITFVSILSFAFSST
jgi:hypothetical protein